MPFEWCVSTLLALRQRACVSSQATALVHIDKQFMSQTKAYVFFQQICIITCYVLGTLVCYRL